MKMKTIGSMFLLVFLLILSGSRVFAQQMNQKIIDPRLNKEILFGYCNRAGLEEGDFGKVFSEYYSVYEPDKKITGNLKQATDSVSITIVMATWCSDSEEQVPKFFKVLDRIRFDGTMVTIICVDREKKAGEIDLTKMDIQRVPTFIIYRKGKESGRIVETPMNSLEGDLLMILED
jgi:thiol-disulfide isomerase/thioredoxin